MSASTEWRTYPVDWNAPGAAVVVGVGAAGAHEPAVEYAVAEAVATGRPLCVVTAAPVHDVGQDRGERAAEAVTRRVREAHPHLELHTALELGDPVEHLLNRSVGQAMLVVGRRGLGPLGRAVRGSTSIALAGRSRVPVVVVPRDWEARRHEGGPVVVADLPGVDGERATAFAATEAAARHVELLSLGEHAPPEMLAAARDAQLLVVGRGHVGRHGFALGAPHRLLLPAAHLPVAVVP
jgi:nucleotide-binding universal stress UspA family protein